jgi:hypothetical protein
VKGILTRFLVELLRKKVLLIAVAASLIVGGIGVGVWAVLTHEEVSQENIVEVGEVKIKGPGDAIFSFAADGYWWPGRTVQKWVTVENIGTLPLDFYITSSGQNTPSYDIGGDGANVCLEVGWPRWDDVDSDDHGVWHIEPGAIQKVLIRVHLPYEADNTVQGDRWNLTFTFRAVQCSELEIESP